MGKKIPRRHHELEILNPVTRALRRKPLHVHKSEKRRHLFVCYPFAIPTVEKAVEIFRVWCAGVVLTWDHSVDLNTVHEGECKCDNTEFFCVLERRFGIRIGEPVLN